MQRLAALLMFAAGLAVMASGANAQTPSDVLKRDYFQAALHAEAQSPVDTVRAPIVFLGDSITANLHPELHIRGAANFGVPGDTTPGILYRMRRLAAVRTADVVVIQGGINDLGFGAEFDRGTVNNFRAMISESPSAARLIVVGLLPVDERADRNYAGYNARIRKINSSIAAACAQRPRCWFIDGSSLRDQSGNLAPLNRKAGDAVHLSDEGNRRLLATLPAIFR